MLHTSSHVNLAVVVRAPARHAKAALQRKHAVTLSCRSTALAVPPQSPSPVLVGLPAGAAA